VCVTTRVALEPNASIDRVRPDTGDRTVWEWEHVRCPVIYFPDVSYHGTYVVMINVLVPEMDY